MLNPVDFIIIPSWLCHLNILHYVISPREKIQEKNFIYWEWMIKKILNLYLLCYVCSIEGKRQPNGKSRCQVLSFLAGIFFGALRATTATGIFIYFGILQENKINDLWCICITSQSRKKYKFISEIKKIKDAIKREMLNK